MSEYREHHTVSRLFGAPPGYVGYDQGGQLSESIRRRPYQVVLFDEIEEAHASVWNTLLQILDEGRLTDGQGHTVDFRNTVIIMTSNVGTQYQTRGGVLGFALSGDAQEEEQRQQTRSALKDTFPPEFLNRLDEIIIFNNLSRDDVVKIVDLQMHELQTRLKDHGLQVTLNDRVKRWLAEQGYDPQFGARPLQRVIQRHIESPLSIRLLQGEFGEGTHIDVDLDEESNTLTFHAEAMHASQDQEQPLPSRSPQDAEVTAPST
jgi:ATP-dependent Clp protease ATP-binding subunit ClpC